jgi:CRISPR system Cascade subunit CasC
MEKTFVDFHVIQTVPPSCVNRDDTGSPKTAVYGGVRRARVSSQSWKRAMRMMFRENFDESQLGVRTKKIIDLVAQYIRVQDDSKTEEEALSLAEKVISIAGVSTKDKAAKALFFMSTKQAQNLAELILRKEKLDKKDAQLALNKNHGIDVALFGRMVADEPALNTDASSQVAHSISTHRVDNEYDYYTAMDDMTPEDSAGAGMIGTVEFNSATLYRYATVAAHELFKQLSEDPKALARTIKEFARAFVTSMPTGKQNTFANRTLPDAVMVSIRKDQPLNLVGAFEEPVQNEGGFVNKSVSKLAAYAMNIYDSFSCPPEKAYAVGENIAKLTGAEKVSFKELLNALEKDMLARF